MTLDPKTQAFLDAVAAKGGPPIYTLSYEEARKVLEDAQAGNAPKAPVQSEDQTLNTGRGGQVSIRIYRPQHPTSPPPVVLYYHGGGWVLGSKNTHDRLLRALTAASRCAFVFVNYTPSPEAQFPVPLEEAYAALKHIADHPRDFALDGSRIAVAGDSVGGNMSAAMALLAKERGGPSLRAQALIYPVTDAGMNTGSYREFADGPWLTAPAMKWFWDAYAPNTADREKPTASPLRAADTLLKGLPPALVLTAENDVLRDEGEDYARKLTAAGVETTAIRYLATIHDFAMLNGLSETAAAKSAIQVTAQFLAAALV